MCAYPTCKEFLNCHRERGHGFVSFRREKALASLRWGSRELANSRHLEVSIGVEECSLGRLEVCIDDL